jgi:hypothetical protein
VSGCRGLARQVLQAGCGEARYQRLRYGLEGRALRRRVERVCPRRLTRAQLEGARRFWRRYNVRLNSSWHRFYAALNPEADPLYFIPEDLFAAYLEPALNRVDLACAYADKNRYRSLFGDVRAPRKVLGRIHGRFVDGDGAHLSADDAAALLSACDGEYVIKPSLGTGGGRLVRSLSVRDHKLSLGWERGKTAAEENTPAAASRGPQGDAVSRGRGSRSIESVHALFAAYGRDFVVQERLLQHPLLARLHPGSLNTLRMITVRLDEDVRLVSCVFRVGGGGGCTDNVSSGGMGCGVALSGHLRGSALDHDLRRFTHHPVTGVPLAGLEVPAWYEACALTKRLHAQLPYFDMASWDIAITEDGQPCLIEVNLQFQEVNGPQCLNGPLFGDWTPGVLDRVFSRVCKHPGSSRAGERGRMRAAESASDLRQPGASLARAIDGGCDAHPAAALSAAVPVRVTARPSRDELPDSLSALPAEGRPGQRTSERA